MLINDHFDKNLGTYNQAIYLLSIVAETYNPRIIDLWKYCSDISMEWIYSFSGSLALLQFLEYLEIEDNTFTHLTDEGKDFLNSNDEGKKDELLKVLWQKLVAQNFLVNIFGNVTFTYDVFYNAISFFRHEIPLQFSALRNFLIDINFFENIQPNRLFVAQCYTRFFENNLLPSISIALLGELESSMDQRLDKNISFEMLQKRLALQIQFGDEAEEFVFRLEQSKFSGHQLFDRIKVISKIDVSAGYDIISLKNFDSSSIDKFIEVKSFSGSHRFFWSQNEISVAKIKGDDYCLYLVDRSRISEIEYTPIIIQNPYKAVFENDEFIKLPESYQISFPSTIT